MKIIKGDTIQITAGKDAGKQGKVEKVFSKTGKIVVTGINQYKRHIKGRLPGQKSGIITITKPLPMGNIALLCQKCKKVTRVGFKILKDEKVRICRKCNAEIKIA
jgi:large subunit ribosomal protein L24